jgi:hypothetical protein
MHWLELVLILLVGLSANSSLQILIGYYVYSPLIMKRNGFWNAICLFVCMPYMYTYTYMDVCFAALVPEHYFRFYSLFMSSSISKLVPI